MPSQRPPLFLARTVHIPSCGSTIALTVLETAPEAVTVLFYPGTMASPLMYAVLLEELHRLGCNVVGIHPLGHGLSQGGKKSFTVQDMLQNGMDAQAWARKHFSGPIVLSGHSQGGILSLAHALQNQDLQAVFPITTLLPHKDEAVEVSRLRSLRSYKPQFLQLVRFIAKYIPALPIPFLAYLELTPLLKHGHKVYVPHRNKRSTYPLSFLSSLFHLDMSAAEQAPGLNCPVILLTAKDDALFKLSLIQNIYESLVAPQKKLIIIQGGGHLCAMSRHYACHIATHMVQSCLALGLTIHTPPLSTETSYAI